MKTSVSRRHFIGKAAATAGLTALGSETFFGNATALNRPMQERLPREVWIATVAQSGLRGKTPDDLVRTVLNVCKRSIVFRPDVLCLPEVFMTTWTDLKTTLEERADIHERLLKEFVSFARDNQVYIICPMLTRENGKIYNSAVILDRQGARLGVYHKMHLPIDELEEGITPGSLHPSVFKTDFGTIGIQICYDCNWFDGWQALKQQGAEIVFWPSAFHGGQILCAKAWENKYAVVTSTWEASRIIDISGEVIAKTDIWYKNIVCAPLNLEKVMVNTWPNVRRCEEIRAKYGRKVKITVFDAENWAIIESLAPDLRVNDILKEFNILSFDQLSQKTDAISEKRRLT